MPDKDAKKTTDQELIDAQNIDAGAARPDDVSPTGPGGGRPDDGPSFEPKQIDPQNIDAGATAPLDVGSESESPTSPSPPSIRVKVQGADLTGDTSDADT
ncbi:MAG: hypothetical protein ACYTEI_03105 [Planctomycetota bacterium]|jgi:hypothetical protein